LGRVSALDVGVLGVGHDDSAELKTEILKKKSRSIPIDTGEKGREQFSILMQSIVLYDLIVGSEVRRELEVTLSKNRENRDVQ
jgi:hypothetical protein